MATAGASIASAEVVEDITSKAAETVAALMHANMEEAWWIEAVTAIMEVMPQPTIMPHRTPARRIVARRIVARRIVAPTVPLMQHQLIKAALTAADRMVVNTNIRRNSNGTNS
jgi:hypothetical protein